MLRYSLLSLFFALSFSPVIWSQVTVCLNILDVSNDSTVQNANISVSYETGLVYVGQSAGNLICNEYQFEGKYSLSVTHPDFNDFTREFRVTPSDSVGDTLNFLIRLKPLRSQKLVEVNVRAPGIPDTVFGSDQMHVQDFAILPNGDIALLTYDRNPRKGSVLRLFNGEQLTYSIAIPGKSKSLYQDYRNNLHVIRDESILSLIKNGDEEYVLTQIPVDLFNRYLIPIEDSLRNKLYYSDFNELYPSFSYYYVEMEDSIEHHIRTITDDLMMELYRSEYKYVDVRSKLWAKEKENATGIDAEIWIGAQFFTQSVYYKALYAPLFIQNNKVLIFDHYADYRYEHDESGVLESSEPIDYHVKKKKTGWKGLIQDLGTEQVFNVYEWKGRSFVGKMDRLNGTVIEKYELAFPYVDKIEVSGNFVYYIYRPFESAQKRFLYRERLPEGFNQN